MRVSRERRRVVFTNGRLFKRFCVYWHGNHLSWWKGILYYMHFLVITFLLHFGIWVFFLAVWLLRKFGEMEKCGNVWSYLISGSSGKLYCFSVTDYLKNIYFHYFPPHSQPPNKGLSFFFFLFFFFTFWLVNRLD